jgi:Flp pilus assembly pilin Flp
MKLFGAEKYLYGARHSIYTKKLAKGGLVPMFGKFLKEEKAQGAIEYILLAGGIIVAAVVIFAIYSQMTQSTATKLNESVGNASGTMDSRIRNEVASQIAT